MSHRGQLQCLNATPSYHSHTMTPSSSHSPVAKMATPQRSASQDSTSDSIRKRVCKACDRCRLKKSKCDGSHPCSRCKADNAICVFGERKRSHDKVYPKGYVEMLEQQQSQLVSGLQEMYKRLRVAGAWTGEELAGSNGHPLTHDILAALDLLEAKHDGNGEFETFEEDCGKLQSKLISQGAGYTQRRGSISSDSDHSQGHTGLASHSTPVLSKPVVFKQDSFDCSAPPSPRPGNSPAPIARQRQSYVVNQPSPLQQASPLSNDPQLYQPEWAYPVVSKPNDLLRSSFAMQAPELDQGLGSMGNVNDFGQWDLSPDSYEKYDYNGMPAATSYPVYASIPRIQDGCIEPMVDVEFNQFLQIMT